MQFRGTVNFAATQTAVWHILTTPNIVSQCAPYISDWTALGSNSQFQLQFTWGSSDNSIIIPLRLTWQTVTPPSLLFWQAEAKMGSTTLLLTGEFRLHMPTSQATILNFTAEIYPPNKLLQQMIQNRAPRFIDNFFSCIKKTAEAI
jgi:carbon monoxide dehydrogenase subunit G